MLLNYMRILETAQVLPPARLRAVKSTIATRIATGVDINAIGRASP